MNDNNNSNFPKLVLTIYSTSFSTKENDGHYSGWGYRKNSVSFDYIQPPDVPSVLVPKIGIYSSHNETVLRYHCAMIKEIGVDVLLLEYYGSNHSDYFNMENEGFSDVTVKLMMKISKEYGLKIGFFIPYYNFQNYKTLDEDLQYISQNYANNPQMFKINNKLLILLSESRDINHFPSLIKKFNNLFFVGYFRYSTDVGAMMEDGYEGIFTYEPYEGNFWSSTIDNWKIISKIAKERNMLFIPTVAPGYNTSNSHRWISERMQRSRDNGNYYNKMWKSAIESNSPMVLINSFNNWIQGTMIEPAIEQGKLKYNVNVWGDKNSNSFKYIIQTKDLIKSFKQKT